MKFLDFSKILSYNATLNFIIGERGVGKTYGMKRFATRDFLKNGNQFIYIRRYKSELESSMVGFFDALIKNNEIKGEHEFKIKKHKGSYEFYIDKQICGFGIALSTAVIQKSREFPYVKNIIFDEFLIPAGNYHYIKNEVEAFLDLVETISRNRDTRVFLIGNAVARINPYFTYFNIDEPYHSEFKTYREGLILVAVLKNLEYREEKKETKFGRLTAGTSYASYAIDNNWLNEDKNFIKKKPDSARFYFTIKMNNIMVGLWVEGGFFYFSSKYEPRPMITFNKEDHAEGDILISASNEISKIIKNKYESGQLCFENQKIKALVFSKLKNILI